MAERYKAAHPIDAAIVLGDLAGASEHKPFVVPYSDGFGSAPELLARTVAGAITQNSGATLAPRARSGSSLIWRFRLRWASRGR